MTGETFFQLHYHLTDTERLFDLAQGIAARRRWLKSMTPGAAASPGMPGDCCGGGSPF